jgi:hypothetical protein
VEIHASAELLMIQHRYEQYKRVQPLWTWLAILLLAVLTLGWAMMTHMAVPDEPRHWDFGVLPDTPGASAYSTSAPPAFAPAPPQVEFPPDRADRRPGDR